MPTVHDDQRAPGLRSGDPRVVALLASVCAFDTVFNGLTKTALRARMAQLYDAGYSSAQATASSTRAAPSGQCPAGNAVRGSTQSCRRRARVIPKLASIRRDWFLET
jgi:hypothetical protein